jgi:two-component system, cell cycle response regulator DivK
VSAAARILVVEDNAMNLELVRDILTAEGYEVLEASDGATGVAIAALERPSLILMDLQLPRMDGLEAARSLRADPRLREIPIVAVTAHAMKGDDEKARAAGCDGFVSKPIQVREFVATVSEFLKRGKRAAD